MKTLNLKKDSWYAKLYRYMFLRTEESLPEDFCTFFKGILCSLILTPFFFLGNVRFILIKYFGIKTKIFKILANLIEIFCITFVFLACIDVIPEINKNMSYFHIFLISFGSLISILYLFVIMSTFLIIIVSSLEKKIKTPKFISAIYNMLKKACSKIDWN
jgi:hypothetical protein